MQPVKRKGEFSSVGGERAAEEHKIDESKDNAPFSYQNERDSDRRQANHANTGNRALQASIDDVARSSAKPQALSKDIASKLSALVDKQVKKLQTKQKKPIPVQVQRILHSALAFPVISQTPSNA